MKHALGVEGKEEKMSIIEQVVETLKTLPPAEQRQVLGYVEGLAQASPAFKSPSGARLLQYAGAFSPGFLDEMEATIEEGCEQVDLNEW
jgi:hypothetical protein